MAFTFTTEYCSDSQRNGVRLQTGIAFIFDRIPHPPHVLEDKNKSVAVYGKIGLEISPKE
jgi:hypothetical protein